MNSELLEILENTALQLTEIAETLELLSVAVEREQINQQIVSSLNVIAHGVRDIKNELNEQIHRTPSVPKDCHP